MELGVKPTTLHARARRGSEGAACARVLRRGPCAGTASRVRLRVQRARGDHARRRAARVDAWLLRSAPRGELRARGTRTP